MWKSKTKGEIIVSTPKSRTTKRIVDTAMLAALTVAGSAIRVTMPIDIGGNTSFHLGNILCALSGLLLGPWYGALAAGLGSAIYDLTNPLYIAECWVTFLTKGAYGLAAGLIMHCIFHAQDAGKHVYLKAALSSACGAITYAVLYLLKSYLKGIWVNGLAPSASFLALGLKLPATIFNGVVAIIFAPVLYVAISAALKKNHLEF